MAIVVLKLPDVKRSREERPKQCRYCAGALFQRWGQVNKPVKDVRVRNVKVYRYRCCECKRTFRHYPEGNSVADQTERLRVFAILLWTLGLSHRASSLILSGWQVLMSHMTIWRDVQEAAQQRKKRIAWKPVRIVGLDGAYVLGWGEKQPVLVAVDLGTGEPLTVGYVDEYDPQAVRRWLEPLVQRHGITVIVTDDLSSYKIVAKKLQLRHQICQFHVRRWVGQALQDLQETVPKQWLWVLAEIQQLIDVLPVEGSKKLYALWKQLPGRRSKRNQARSALEQLRDLLLRLSEDWSTYCTFQSEPEVPWTNNATERAIGRMKMRARTIRGYKSWPGMESGLLLAGTYTP
ncbi:MAG TPA: transposase [Anaerolineales bacterium]|nr:transposase [Anaerolineales bacterium]